MFVSVLRHKGHALDILRLETRFWQRTHPDVQYIAARKPRVKPVLHTVPDMRPVLGISAVAEEGRSAFMGPGRTSSHCYSRVCAVNPMLRMPERRTLFRAALNRPQTNNALESTPLMRHSYTRSCIPKPLQRSDGAKAKQCRSGRGSVFRPLFKTGRHRHRDDLESTRYRVQQDPSQACST